MTDTKTQETTALEEWMPSPEVLEEAQESTPAPSLDDDSEADEYENRKRRQRYSSHLQEIPKRYRDYRLSDCLDYYEEPSKVEAAEQACRFVEETPGIYPGPQERCALLFGGGFGTGKTVLATATYKALLWSKDTSGRWRKWHEIVRDVQSTYSPGAERTSSSVIKGYQTCTLLLIDDVGDLDDAKRGERATDDRRQILYEILDARHGAMRPTLLTTNLASEDELIQQWGERTFNRILEMSRYVQVGGKNFRLPDSDE